MYRRRSGRCLCGTDRRRKRQTLHDPGTQQTAGTQAAHHRKGRCNLTNNCDRDTLLANIPANGKFLYSALSRCTPQDVMAYFEGLGVPLKTERGNRVFPVSDRAEDIVQALQKAVQRAGIPVVHGDAAHLILEQGRCLGVRTADGREFRLGQRSSPPADFPTPRPAQTAQAIVWQKRQVTPSCRLCPR